MSYSTTALRIPIIGLAAEARNPSFVVKHPTLNCYYSDSGRGIDGQGSVDAWEKQADGSLKKLNSQRSGGQGPCHLSVHPNGKCLFVANYSGSSSNYLYAITILVQPSSSSSISSLEKRVIYIRTIEIRKRFNNDAV